MRCSTPRHWCKEDTRREPGKCILATGRHLWPPEQKCVFYWLWIYYTELSAKKLSYVVLSQMQQITFLEMFVTIFWFNFRKHQLSLSKSAMFWSSTFSIAAENPQKFNTLRTVQLKKIPINNNKHIKHIWPALMLLSGSTGPALQPPIGCTQLQITSRLRDVLFQKDNNFWDMCGRWEC